MAEKISLRLRADFTPGDMPGLIAYWRLDAGGETFEAAEGERYVLRSQAGKLEAVDGSLKLTEGQWLNIAREDCPKLNIHGPGGQVTVVAWIKRERTTNGGCEFIAGQWNETERSRQYGLFLNIGAWGEHQQVTGHLSHVGGPTPGWRFCVDGPVGATAVPWDQWVMVAMSYDGQMGYAWLDGALDVRPGLNPYSLAGGLHDGGPRGSDFTVGAVDRSGVVGNFFRGQIAGLAVYGRALTPGEMAALGTMTPGAPSA